jgi:hypothetical protein
LKNSLEEIVMNKKTPYAVITILVVITGFTILWYNSHRGTFRNIYAGAENTIDQQGDPNSKTSLLSELGYYAQYASNADYSHQAIAAAEKLTVRDDLTAVEAARAARRLYWVMKESPNQQDNLNLRISTMLVLDPLLSKAEEGNATTIDPAISDVELYLAGLYRKQWQSSKNSADREKARRWLTVGGANRLVDGFDKKMRAELSL